MSICAKPFFQRLSYKLTHKKCERSPGCANDDEERADISSDEDPTPRGPVVRKEDPLYTVVVMEAKRGDIFP